MLIQGILKAKHLGISEDSMILFIQRIVQCFGPDSKIEKQPSNAECNRTWQSLIVGKASAEDRWQRPNSLCHRELAWKCSFFLQPPVFYKWLLSYLARSTRAHPRNHGVVAWRPRRHSALCLLIGHRQPPHLALTQLQTLGIELPHMLCGCRAPKIVASMAALKE